MVILWPQLNNGLKLSGITSQCMDALVYISGLLNQNLILSVSTCERCEHTVLKAT